MEKKPEAPNVPVDPRVRLAIATWPDDAPRGSVSDFCRFHGISRKSFYKIRAIARQEGQMAALEPRSRRPLTSPTRITEDREQEALDVREILESTGLDAGPVSVFDTMQDMGVDPPSVASLSRIFRRAGVARHQPQKKPHSAYQRFEYPAPNACWQLDAMEYHLARGRKVAIFQLIDDHSRLALASLVAKSENHRDAIKVVSAAIERHGIPQKLLTDNGSALNPSRRGALGKLALHAMSMGITCITGKPGHPTTQGKVERIHQTLIRYLDTQPDAKTIAELQAQVDAFDHIYNTQRRHQALEDHRTPRQAFDATDKAEEPTPPAIPPILIKKKTTSVPAPDTTPRHKRAYAKPTDTTGQHHRTLGIRGGITFRSVHYPVSRRLAGKPAILTWTPTTVSVYDTEGTHLITYPAAPPGITNMKREWAYKDDAPPSRKPRK